MQNLLECYSSLVKRCMLHVNTSHKHGHTVVILYRIAVKITSVDS
jgi:hypothetical protein